MIPHQRDDRRLVIWRITDAKTGHDNQSLGLTEALGRLVDTEVHTVPSLGAAAALGRWWSRRFPEVQGLPDPRLIVGAGHGTHATLLVARRCRGGRAVVLMSPSVPTGWFDLCLVPSHDDADGPRVIRTFGPLNRIRPGQSRRGATGPILVLVGGPSRHFVWRDDHILTQLAAVLDADPGRPFTLATSRRTPASLVASLQALLRPGVEVVPHESTGNEWLADRIADTSEVWVTEDSVSMIYEALTSGAAVGLIGLERGHPNRVSEEIDRLCARGWLYRPAPGTTPSKPAPPARVVDEASRCAGLILRRWPELRS